MALDSSLLRLWPIMMTALVACLAAAGGYVHRHRQRFAEAVRIVIVGGLASRLLLSVFLSPVLN
jgi:multidrug efflux pump subunit AcrB